MKGRILELANEAFAYSYQFAGIREDGTVLSLHPIMMEKFAELIVRECAQIAKTAEPWRSDDLILKHFGME